MAAVEKEDSFLTVMVTDLRQQPDYATYMQGLGWTVHVRNSVYVYERRVAGVGVMKVQRVKLERLDMTWLNTLRAKRRTLITVIEPDAISDYGVPQLVWSGYRKVGGYVPTCTWVCNLTDVSWWVGSKSKTRYNASYAARHGVRCVFCNGCQLSSQQRSEFIAVVRDNAKRVGYWGSHTQAIIQLMDAFGSNAQIGMALNSDGSMLAVGLFLGSGSRLYYSYNGSRLLGRKLKAPTYLLVELFRRAGELGYTHFDFDGVTDADFPQSRWRGFSRFKQQFGGIREVYPGAYARYGWWS